MSIDADYRMCFIKAHHKDWGDKVYTGFATKARYPNKKDANHLVTSYLLDEIKKRLDGIFQFNQITQALPIDKYGLTFLLIYI